MNPEPGMPMPSTSPVGQLEALQAQLAQLQAQNAELKQALGQQQPPAEPTLAELPPQQAVDILLSNPVSFVTEIVNTAAQKHLVALKDEAELRGALNIARKAHPEFRQFESLILKEVEILIQNDPDGVIDPWDKLFEKAVKNFQGKFREIIKQKPDMLKGEGETGKPSLPYMEGKANRAMPDVPPSFSRDQIARMSLDEFLANEAAINEAMKLKRIR